MTKEARTCNGGKTVSLINGAGTAGQVHEKMELDSAYTKCKNKLKWIKDLQVRPGTIKLLQENLGSEPFDMGLTVFLGICLLRQRKQKQK